MARALEMEGITTVIISWNRENIQRIRPPRTLISPLQQGMTLGRPHNRNQQRDILATALNLLSLDAP